MNRNEIRVLVIAPYRFLPAVNGGHKAIERLYTYLGELVPVTIVSVKSNDEPPAGHFRLVRLFGNSPLHYINPFAFFALKKMIREERITHIITEHPYMGWLAFLLQKVLRVSWVLRSHNIEAMRFKTLGKWWWKMMWRYEKWVCSKADLTFFITGEDREWAAQNYHLPEEKGTVITYGTDNDSVTSATERNEAKLTVCRQYNIDASHRLLLFNGDLGYTPNAEAVEMICDEIYPLLQRAGLLCTILICGRNLNEPLQKKISDTKGSIVYAGFVKDIRQVFMAADVFINPVVSGGGIKTKLVEALSYGTHAVSTASGAIGVPAAIAGEQLQIVPDKDRVAFAKAVENIKLQPSASADFYSYFYWGNIARKALYELENLQPQ